MKVLKNLEKALSESRLGLVLFIGFFLLIIICLSLSQNFTASITNAFLPVPLTTQANNSLPMQEQQGEKANNYKGSPYIPPKCDFKGFQHDVCDMSGDARTLGVSSTVFFVPPHSQIKIAEAHEWSVRTNTHIVIPNKIVTLKSLNNSQESPRCTAYSKIPGVVLGLSGLTGNPWHDFNDVLIPLFTTSIAFDSEVQFLVTRMETWFVEKYSSIFKALSRYEMIDFDNDTQVRCYSQLTIGLKSHRLFGINSAIAPRNYSMVDFKMFIRKTYSVPVGVDVPYKEGKSLDKKPRMLLITRGGSRKFLNLVELVEMIEKAGFEVVQIEPKRDANMTEFVKLVDSVDVLMGVHGAALTNMLYLRTNAVLIQMIPYGVIELIAMLTYGGPAIDMKLRYVQYNMIVEESTLLERFGRDHPVIKDPESIYKKGEGIKYYWKGQDLRVNLTRFAPILDRALELVRE